ncbi:MAG: GLPGLI family protein [Weeksellaceae bacterium]|jgi:GLPGLI family protein|nr:GLPGLI family protein [Weeksellaceae bacterium]
MKKTIFLLLLSFSSFILAQENLVVKYEYQWDIDFEEFMKNRSEMSLTPEIQKQIQETLTTPRYFTLRLSSGESVYSEDEKIDNSQWGNGATGTRSSHGANPLYKNLKENFYLQTKVVARKNFLVKDELTEYGWKISKETKEILGYEVRKAEFSDSTKTIIAWYAPKLPFKNGPEYLQGLPGLILDVEIDQTTVNNQKSKSIWKVLSIEVDKNSLALEKPTKGKPMNEKEFQQIVKDHHKKSKEMYGGGVDKD